MNRGADSDSDELRKVLRARLETATRSALKTKGEIPADELASLERISRALALSDGLKPSPRRWVPAAALLIALSLVSALMMIRVSETEITLEADVSEVAFTLAAEKTLLSRVEVGELTVSGIGALRVSPDTIASLSSPSSDDEARTVRIIATNTTGGISIAPLSPPAGTTARLSQPGPPRHHRLSISAPAKGTGISLRTDVRGEVILTTQGLPNKATPYNFGKSGATFDFEAHNDVMDADFVQKEAEDLTFYAQVPVETLVLSRIEEINSPQKSLVSPISSIKSGTLHLESLNGEKLELRTGELLRFTSSKGRIEQLKLQTGSIAFKFRGTVSGMKAGEDDTARDLMPTWLDWLKARQPLSLLWGTTVFVYGLIVSAASWYRKDS